MAQRPLLRVWRHPAYALFMGGGLPSYLTSWMQRVGVGCLTWELTHSTTWLGIVASGAAGNWINAWGYRGLRELHLSIGASTAVFGALGMLVGWQVVAALREEEGTRADHVLVRRVWFPIAAGLALLAYLGTGDPGQRIDVMAHFFGAVSGGCLGVALAWARLPQRTSDWLQTVLAIVALFMPCAAWLIALRHSA